MAQLESRQQQLKKMADRANRKYKQNKQMRRDEDEACAALGLDGDGAAAADGERARRERRRVKKRAKKKRAAAKLKKQRCRAAAEDKENAAAAAPFVHPLDAHFDVAGIDKDSAAEQRAAAEREVAMGEDKDGSGGCGFDFPTPGRASSGFSHPLDGAMDGTFRAAAEAKDEEAAEAELDAELARAEAKEQSGLGEGRDNEAARRSAGGGGGGGSSSSGDDDDEEEEVLPAMMRTTRSLASKVAQCSAQMRAAADATAEALENGRTTRASPARSARGGDDIMARVRASEAARAHAAAGAELPDLGGGDLCAPLAEAASELCSLNESVERTIARWQQMYALDSDDDQSDDGDDGDDDGEAEGKESDDVGDDSDDEEDDDMTGLGTLRGGTAAELGALRGDLASINSKVGRADQQVALLMERIQRDLGIIVQDDKTAGAVRLDLDARVPSRRPMSRAEAKEGDREPENASDASDDDTPFSVTQIIAEANAVLEQREEALCMFDDM